MEWKDRKKRYDDDEIVSSEVKIGQFKLTIHRHIHYEPDDWLASSVGLFDQKVLPSKDLNEAKRQAVTKVQSILEAALKDIN